MPEPSAKLMVLLAPAPMILPLIVPPEMFSTSALAESLMSPAISPPVCAMVTGLVAAPTSIAVPPDGAGIDDCAASRKHYAIANADSGVGRDRAGIADVAGKG